jgi:Flp pilus assembly protein TadG
MIERKGAAMIRRADSIKRMGAVTLEAAVVYPVMFILLLGLIVGGMGVFRYQQVACQAREAARWASVRGYDYAITTGNASPSSQAIFQNAVVPMAAGMDTTKLSIQVLWVDQSTGQAQSWDTAPKTTKSIVSNQYVTNTVRVIVTYQWTPNFFLAGSINLKSTSEIPMSF